MFKRIKSKLRTQNSRMRRLRKNTRQQAGAKGNKIKFVETKLKMSEVLQDFMSPYSGEIETTPEYEALVRIAAFAWNAAIMSPKRQKRILKRAPIEVRTNPKLFQELLEHKKQHFAHIKRKIIHYEVTETKHGWHLAVSSSLTSEEESKLGF
ncbi:MAG: hypothetical protein GY803_02725 [Chloroflexi bacterium]|nr:hypothetical protein [Chloroflexota bacterium]